jgi:hypothetical protein
MEQFLLPTERLGGRSFHRAEDEGQLGGADGT